MAARRAAPRRLSRRAFLKSSALLGGSTLLGPQLARALAPRSPGQAPAVTGPEHFLYSVCQQCNTQCGIKVRIEDGLVAKIDGNPYSPWTLNPHLPFATPVTQAAAVDGYLCPKGQAAIQTTYDPYRLLKVLKRAGKRGENKWVTIPFEQAITEIVEGGLLFKDVPGEEHRHVDGLRAIRAAGDPDVLKALAADARKVAKKEMPLAAFRAKHAAALSLLIDPEHPDLGPKNNQFVFMWGRLKGGRSELIRRFTEQAMGSVNAHGHTTVCQGSLYFTGKAMSEQFVFDETDKKMKWTKGSKFYWQGDQQSAEFMLFVGASPLEGNYGVTNRASRIAQRIADGDLKIAVVDPRASKTAAKAWRWVPIAPGGEGALALGMIRWIIESRRYDARYLTNANKAAAAADGEPTWCNATWLVKLEQGRPGAFLRASEIGLPVERRVYKDKKTGEETVYDFDPFVVLRDGKPVAFDPYAETVAVEGDLMVKTEINKIPVRSAFQLLWEEASSRTLEQWAALAGIRAADIVDLAREFTSHGKRAVADIHRGVSQHTNGFYQVFAWYTLNLLIGNYDWKGGLAKATTYDPAGTKKDTVKGPDGKEIEWAQPFPVTDFKGKLSPFGISLIRHGEKYEDTTLFAGYPAKRPWYPLASDIYQEIIPSAGDAYPYPIKALFIYMGSPVYALPAGHTNIEILADPAKIPLIVANDIVIGETSMYADYIFPDLSNLERWEFAGSHPNMIWKVQPVRQPVVAPMTETVRVYGQEMPLSLEAMILGLAEKLGLPGFGPDGFGPGQPFTHPDHLYLRMAANLAVGDKPGQELPEASDEELRIFLEARRHLPKSVFDPARWEGIVGKTLWRRVVFLLNRGGRFDDFEQGYDGERLKNKYGTLINFYQEKTAKTKDSMTGAPLPGLAVFRPSPVDATGRALRDEQAGYDLRLITYREVMHTKSRTVSNYWLQALLPENSLLMNERDAAARGLRDGDRVRIRSASNPDGVWDFKNGATRPIEGRLKVVQGIRPGVVAFSLGHGHWAYGAGDVIIDGKVVKGDRRRGTGLHANAALRVDPVLKNTTLVDLTGGSAVFYDTQVKVTKA
ncbi:MAG: molybdopterin dinucleotide binding domain-containing protein [Armatimonadota bacterium]|nr:molybdopterin dinucleotide binding domain-containing protein [Armatimonadota bacterium]MDR7450842.1 molybdopterin dinucleotide binding domain-containing protein [Armatimonadota bacterium]MDR7465763.1 molybdopterin dinucleotide binding domain-containing protein [Armatimonadota bacterium]MDR7493671.1 molybdopterin dinucleotide binding domain-containing protein [Armatimonadota bacterium]MDR7499080.1 molybdopterin dinucleotide binding domain-containing protein [Armatimonadota bacterium]